MDAKETSAMAMTAPKQRYTHPLVLMAAIGLTVFSILGSAAITGLFPQQFSEVFSRSGGQAYIAPVPAPGNAPEQREANQQPTHKPAPRVSDEHPATWERTYQV